MPKAKDDLIHCGKKTFTRDEMMMIGTNVAQGSNGRCVSFDEGEESILFDIHTSNDSWWEEVQFEDLASYQ